MDKRNWNENENGTVIDYPAKFDTYLAIHEHSSGWLCLFVFLPTLIPDPSVVLAKHEQTSLTKRKQNQRQSKKGLVSSMPSHRHRRRRRRCVRYFSWKVVASE